MPLEISNSDLDEYEKYLGKSLNDEDREVILKFTSFRRILTIRKRLKLSSLENISSSDLLNNK
ncbi:LIMLP_19325 family protein [Leptospira borgpetersenii]